MKNLTLMLVAGGLFTVGAGVYIWLLDERAPTGIGLIILGLVGISFSWFFARRSEPSREIIGSEELKQSHEELKQSHEELKQSYEDLIHKLKGNRIPKICELGEDDKTVPELPEKLPSITPEQLHVMQQLFVGTYRIHIKSLEGGYNNFGVYKVIQENPSTNFLTPGVIVKFLNYRDVVREMDVHQPPNGLLHQYPLDNTPGRPLNHWPSDDQHQVIDQKQLGAIAYTLTLLNNKNHLQTLGSFYRQSSFEDFTHYLEAVFESLKKWHTQKVSAIPLGGSEGVYERLYRKREDIQEGIIGLLDRGLQIVDTSNINFENEKLPELSFLPKDLPKNWQNKEFDNPLYWINKIFKANTATFFSNKQITFSPVHGDLHSGNVLVEAGQDNIWLIDFPNAEKGPVIQDIATLEADIKFSLIDLEKCSFEDWLKFEEILMRPLSTGGAVGFQWPFLDLQKEWTPNDEELCKAWDSVKFLRQRVVNQHLIGQDIRAYYLALLHETLPIVYRDKYTEQQKQCALISSAWMCHYLT